MFKSAGVLWLSPSDLLAGTACAHLLHLERLKADGTLAPPVWETAQADVIASRGMAHEKRYLESLRAAGRQVVEIETHGGKPKLAADATLQAMVGGAEIIYQATFFDGRWCGQADFLFKVPGVPSKLGAWSYEVVDTKLARSAKASAVLQLVLYAMQVERIQEVLPPQVHLQLGSDEAVWFQTRQFSAYARRRMEQLEGLLAAPCADTYPVPVAHCAVCRWDAHCEAQRRGDDHLSLVAGMRADQVMKLQAKQINTLATFAAHEALNPRDIGIGGISLTRLHRQAQLQLRQRQDGAVHYELLTAAAGRGLGLLPEPCHGDIFFDMEGDPLVMDGGLEYLFGFVTQDGGNQAPAFTALWAHDRVAEKRAFEGFIHWVMARRQRWPHLHIYHYAPYERTALGTLAMRHATCEEEVDDLLRGETLVDLYAVVRQALVVSQESYSIKKLEPLYMDKRQAAIKDAASSIVEYERYLELGQLGAPAAECQALLDGIQGYNEEDCRSTLLLRNWLEARRAEHTPLEGWTRPPALDDQATTQRRAARDDIERLTTALQASAPDDVADRTAAEQARWLLSHLLEWHRRESKPEWWAYFSRKAMDEEALYDDPEALSGLRYEGPDGKVDRSTLHRFSFDPTQEHKIALGKDYEEPFTGQQHDVVNIDRVQGMLHIKAGNKSDLSAWSALIPTKPRRNAEQQKALAWIAEGLLAGNEADHQALLALLERRPPVIRGAVPGPVAPPDADTETFRRVAANIDNSYLAVQGPPGAGKTYTGARMIVAMLKAGQRVAVTAHSHQVITNLLAEVMGVAADEKCPVRALQRTDHEDLPDIPGVQRCSDNKQVEEHIAHGTADLVAGTAWLLSRAALRKQFGTVVVDEAGQMSLANVAAVSTCAKNLLLLGDPCQLSQPSKGTHPEGAGISALAHVLGDQLTIPDTHGIFLPTTRRMHSAVCNYISQTFYEGRLHAHSDCDRQHIYDPSADAVTGSGLRWCPVLHEARSTEAPEEVEAIKKLVNQLLGRTWQGKTCRRPLTLQDILIVAPFNVQVAALKHGLGARARIGTVDKFQGQQAPVVIYSMTASAADSAPRGMNFLYDRERLNVAISRAQGMAILVCAPALLVPPCRTIEQMRLANNICQFVRQAVEIRLP